MLKAETGTITMPGATGNQTINLADTAFGQVKAVIITCVGIAADNSDVDGSMYISHGFGTFRGGSVQQFCHGVFSIDAVGSSQTGRYQTDASIMRLITTDSTTINGNAALVSLGDASFVINWVALNSVASIRLHYLALGGTDITDAFVNTFTMDSATGTGTQDVSVASGFGPPDLIWWGASGSAVPDDNQGSAQFNIGGGRDPGNQATMGWGETDASANMAVGMTLNSSFINYLTNGAGAAALGQVAELTAKQNWPVDGFQINKTANSIISLYGFLALRGTFSCKIRPSDTPTAAPTVNQDLGPLEENARCAIVFHNAVPRGAGVDNSSADLGMVGIGFLDGTHERWCGAGQDDGNGTSVTHRHISDGKSLRMFTPAAAGTLIAEADGSLFNIYARLAFNDTDATARGYAYVVLGDALTRMPAHDFSSVTPF